jgi:hypothetical protein
MCQCIENNLTISFIKKSGKSVRESIEASVPMSVKISYFIDPFLDYTGAALCVCVWLGNEAQ